MDAIQFEMIICLKHHYFLFGKEDRLVNYLESVFIKNCT